MEDFYTDILVIGSGPGGAAAAYGLVSTGLRIVVLERGEYVKQEDANWDPDEVITRNRYLSGEVWRDGEGATFVPRVHYNVGGNSKFYGGSAFRLRERDFDERVTNEGISAAWPISYDELKPYYQQAEQLWNVHGVAGEDPTEPPRGPYPAEAVPHEENAQRLHDRLAQNGNHPFHLPITVNQGPGEHCRKGSPCDGFPCKIRAKNDAENSILRRMRKDKNLELWTGTRVDKLETDDTGTRIVAAIAERAGSPIRVRAPIVILAAGAVNSALILLRSRSHAHPQGLANSSGLVGRNYMNHHNTVLLAINPFRKNSTRFQKTLAVNDFYDDCGNIQLRGKVLPQNLRKKKNPFFRWFRKWISSHSTDFWLMSEDMGHAENRVYPGEDGIPVLEKPVVPLESHKRLVKRTKQMLRRCGFFVFIREYRGISAVQHQCGTLRFGSDPENAVLDRWCRAFDVDNLYVTDTSVFPSSGAVNPALTCLANALRVSEHIKQQLMG